MNQPFSGIFPALVTPYDDNDKIDTCALNKVVERCLGQGVDGFYVGGSTGESLLLGEDERRLILEKTIEAVQGRAKVLAQVGCIGTKKTIELAKHAKDCGADAVSSIPPIYFSFSTGEIVNYYLSIADSVDLPLFLYHVPALSGVNMDGGVFAELLRHPNIAGIKFTAHNGYQLQRLISGFPEKTFISGHDEIFINNYAVGCRSAIGSTFNVMADKFVEMRRLLEAGNMQKALAIQNQVNGIIDTMIKYGVFQSVKEALRLLGIGNGKCRLPFQPLSEAASAELKAKLIDAGYQTEC